MKAERDYVSQIFLCVSLGFIAGKMERGCDCFYFHITMIMIIFNLIRLKQEFFLSAKRFLLLTEPEDSGWKFVHVCHDVQITQ